MVIPFGRARKGADTRRTAPDAASGDVPPVAEVPKHPPEVRHLHVSPRVPSHSSVRVMEIASHDLMGGLAGLPDGSAGPVDVAAMFDAEAASLTRLARFYVDDKTAAVGPARCPLGGRDG